MSEAVKEEFVSEVLGQMTPAIWNAIHREYWRERRGRLEPLLDDRLLVDIVVKEIEEQNAPDGRPLGRRRDFYVILEEKRLFLSNLRGLVREEVRPHLRAEIIEEVTPQLRSTLRDELGLQIRKTVLGDLGRAGGRKKTADRLQTFIEENIKRETSFDQLLAMLKTAWNKEAGNPNYFILQITGDIVTNTLSDGTRKDVNMKALKVRLDRAKKKLFQR